MIHLDLFSGIGGFAYAADQVWENTEHIFVENDSFCQQVLIKHWPQSKIYGDIKTFTNTTSKQTLAPKSRRLHAESSLSDRELTANARSIEQRRVSSGKRKEVSAFGEVYLLTGGFPCQPFSQAGRRKGTADDRYLWPEMFRVIREFKPEWVIAENVAGLVTWNEGMVLEQVCSDLENEGYEVQPFIIPAVAVNAPHRRDRVWIIGHAKHDGFNGTENGESNFKGSDSDKKRKNELRQFEGTNSLRQNTPDTESTGGERKRRNKSALAKRTRHGTGPQQSWNENWLEVATRLCRVDDGIRHWMDGRGQLRNSRNPRLKSLGNAIVPTVAEQIMQAIRLAEQKQV